MLRLQALSSGGDTEHLIEVELMFSEDAALDM